MNKIGLCCISEVLKENKISFSTMTKTSYNKHYSHNKEVANKILADRTLNNIVVLRKTLQLCAKNNWNYRINSNILLLYTLPNIEIKYPDFYNFTNIKQELNTIKETISKHNIRCSMHPDQYVVIGSKNPKTVSNSIVELEYHGHLMDLFGLPRNYHSPINIHINCYVGEPLTDIAKRFKSVYDTLSDGVKSRLVVECEDKPNSWSVSELYDNLYSDIKIPITYDSHHFRLNSKNTSVSTAIELCMSTWGNTIPLFHFSNGKESIDDNSHSDYVYDIHNELFENKVDVDFEFKKKDMCIIDFTKRYSNLINKN